MKKNPKPLSWTPRRRGATYCAPACGGRCTWAAHQQAETDAKQLAETLGAGWKPRVWENLGWHFSAEREVIAVHKHGADYTAIFNGPGHSVVGRSRSPRLAVKRALQEMKNFVDGLSVALKAAS
jgi:hypothetical protein